MKMVSLVFLMLVQVNLEAKEIAISFDDAPRRITGHFTRLGRAQALVKQLKAAKVDAVFYCNSNSINKDTAQIIQLYNDAGFKIANHTHSHPDFNKLSFKEYSEDFLKAHAQLSSYSNHAPLFRFPYLREGNEVKKRDQMRELLKKKGYTNAYITVDFNDWHLEHLFRESLSAKQSVDLQKLKKLYLDLAKESLEHYDQLAVKHLGRSPKHVLLLHETDLAALFIKDLVSAMRSWGWKVISSREAYTDDIASYQIQRTLGNNPGRVGEIALDEGHPMKDIWADSTNTQRMTRRYQSEVLGQK